MESKFEILSYQNCNDLKKAINPSSVLIGAVTLLLGLYLAIFVSVSDPTSNLNMLRLAAGWVLAGFGLVTLVFNPRRWMGARRIRSGDTRFQPSPMGVRPDRQPRGQTLA